MKVKALITFNDLEAKEKRIANESVWKCSKERAEFLLKHNAIEILEEEKKNELGNPEGTRELLKDLAKDLAGFDSVSELPVEEKPKKKRTKKSLQDK